MGNFQIWVIFDSDCSTESHAFFSRCLMDRSHRHSWAHVKIKVPTSVSLSAPPDPAVTVDGTPFLRHADTCPYVFLPTFEAHFQ